MGAKSLDFSLISLDSPPEVSPHDVKLLTVEEIRTRWQLFRLIHVKHHLTTVMNTCRRFFLWVHHKCVRVVGL